MLAATRRASSAPGRPHSPQATLEAGGAAPCDAGPHRSDAKCRLERQILEVDHYQPRFSFASLLLIARRPAVAVEIEVSKAPVCRRRGRRNIHRVRRWSRAPGNRGAASEG